MGLKEGTFVSDKQAFTVKDKQAFPMWMTFLFILLALIKLWLVSGQPLTAIAEYIYDDRLFLDLAQSLIRRDWLGPYMSRTLIKGPFYPIWIAGSFFTGVPLLLSQHLSYIAACISIVIALRPAPLKPAALLALYAVLLFNPMTYADGVANRVLREGIYSSLTLFVFTLTAGLYYRVHHPLRTFGLWAAGLGCALSAFWLTREEGMWIIPSLAVVIIFIVVKLIRDKPSEYLKRLALCMLPFVLLSVSLGSVAGINKFKYGVFATVEVKSPDFLAAYGALTRVKHANWRPQFPVPRETRERIYKVSPSFAELRSWFEGLPGKNMIADICKYAPVCDDIVGGWFLWSLREAADAAGHHASGQKAMKFYRKIADEVNAACNDGRLDCLAERNTLLSPWHNEYFRPLLSAFFHAFQYLVRMADFTPSPWPSKGVGAQLALFRDLTHERLTLSPEESAKKEIIGWAFVPSTAERPLNLSVRHADGSLVQADIKIQTSNDIFEHFLAGGDAFPNARNLRFVINAFCEKECCLQFESDRRIIKRIPLDGSVKYLTTPELYLGLDSIYSQGDVFPLQSKINAVKITILGGIGRVYQALMPIVVAPALLMYIVIAIRTLRTRTLTRFWPIVSFCILAVTARLFIISMIDVSSFPSIRISYLSPAFSLLLIFAVLTLADFITLFQGRIKDT